ncbi:MAG: aminotransferase class III-fold pyridoxal phosphate-dependent enzyme, partial [Bryobacteraceae bacterium]
MVEDLSGIAIGADAVPASFLDLGFDSLFLTQVAQAVQAKFGTKITFRQLMDQESSVEALAAYLDAHLPAEAFAAPVAAPPSQAAPASAPAAQVVPAPVSLAPAPSMLQAAPAAVDGAGANALERIVATQLQTMQHLMAQQLEMLRGGSVMAAPVAAPASVTPQPVPVAAPAAVPAEKGEFKPFGPYKPVQKGTTGDLTPGQQTYLDSFIERYNRRTAESKRQTQRYRAVLADPRVAAGFRSQWKDIVYPIVTVRSQGSKLWDVDGNEYVDILNGFGPIAFGHRPDFVVEAVAKQLHQGIEIGPQTPLAGQVAELLCEITGHERATFCNTGSEAVTAAIRIARTVTARNRVVIFAGAYHGMFDEVLVKGIKRGDTHRSLPIAPGIPNAKAENITVLDYATPESLEYIRAHAGELAAVLVEPVQSRHPNLQPREFLQQLREITAASGTALIIDEVVTGFRVHPGGVQALFNIKADLATYGKVLGGGMPIGALAGKAAFMDALDGGTWQYGDASFPEAGVTFFAGTFVRHPLAMAAALAVLQHVKASGPQLQERLTQKTAQMVARINEFLASREMPVRLETFGSIFYFSFPSDLRFGSLFYYHLREKGVHVQEGFPCFLTTTHSDADVEHIVRAFESSVIEMQEGGLLPAPERLLAAVSQQPEGPGEAPLTESQVEIWLSAHLGPDASASYNESFSLILRGALNEPALRSSLVKVIARHDALRASFGPDGDVQRFAPAVDIDLPLTDLSTLHPDARQAQLEEMIADDAHLPFDLIQGPLVRMKLVRMTPEHHVLRFTTHHIVCDGWSTNVLLDELSKLYNAACAGGRADLPVPMKFGDYARSQQSHFLSAEGAKIEEYWTRQFAEVPPLLDLPTDRPRPSMKSFTGATYRTKIDAAAYQRIKRAGAKQKCTLFVTLLAGFDALLARLSGQEDVV